MHVYRWNPAGPPRAAVQIVHGLSEHAGRYAALADRLNEAGYLVYANDHRGHGRTAASGHDLGFFAGRRGWQKCLDDLLAVRRQIAGEHPGLPVVLLGHSMGSLLARDFISRHGELFTGAVLSASPGPPSPLAQAGRLIARLERLRLGPRGRSRLIHALAFGAFNRAFTPARTSFDWLSRDEAEVDRYLADPLCGFPVTVQLWIDLLDALGKSDRPAQLARIPRNLPIHFIAGTSDPAAAPGREKLPAAYRKAGLTRVTSRGYADARHELFHETNREEVVRDLIAWLDLHSA